MKPEEQRIKIAEACGLTEIGWMYETLMHAGTGTFLEVPDYLNDLNAMHEAEIAGLNWNEQASPDLFNYRCALHKLMGNDPSLWGFASAAQRAEAFLKALNLWTP